MACEPAGVTASDQLRLVDPPIPHFYKAVAAFRESSIVRGHHQRDAFRNREIE
jgi:hypothetical protein